MDTGRATAWRERGSYFSWAPDVSVSEVQIFHVEAGDPDAPVMLLVHGFPTSSIDWFGVVDRFSASYRVCMLDFPGYGFSEKPPKWGYSLSRDAQLLDFYLSEIIGAASSTVVAHDRGDSVALVHTTNQRDRVEHLVLSNGNVFLPLSNLTSLQQLLLGEATAPEVLERLTPELFARGMGHATFTPPRNANDAEVDALAETFAHNDGIAVLHETIQYLRERSENETAWLERLASATVPTTVIWGLNDTVSPPRVALHVWDHYFMFKPGRNSLYFIPQANHYVQNDRPDAFVDAVLHALDTPADSPPGAISTDAAAPILVDRSRTQLPNAVDVLAAPPDAIAQLRNRRSTG